MKRTALTALKIAVSLALYAYIFSKVEVSHLWEILKDADVTLFIAGIGVYFLIQSLSAYRWQLLLRPLGLEASYRKLLSFYLLGMYFNFFLPTAIGGDVVRVYYLNKETRKLSRATASVFLDRDLGMAALLAVAMIVATAAGTRLPLPGLGDEEVRLAPLFGIVAIAFTLANLAIFYRPTYNLLHKVLRLLRMKRADEKVEHLFASVNSYRGKWALLAGTMIISIVIQLGGVFINVLVARSININTQNGWIDFLVFIPAISLISMVPLSVNGMGWREVSYIVLFQTVGVAQAQAAALAFLWLGVLVLTSLPGGIIYVMRGSKGPVTLADADPVGPQEPIEPLQESYAELQPPRSAGV